ncbi:23706_t:CDS:2, partial [Racocetra persica]
MAQMLVFFHSPLLLRRLPQDYQASMIQYLNSQMLEHVLISSLLVNIIVLRQNVTSVWLHSRTKSLFETSMTSPHVAGVIALIIAQYGNMLPARMKTKIRDMTTRG